MTPGMYANFVPVTVWALRNLGGILTKGQTDAEARGYAPEVLIGARLAPDMFPLSRQVQIASDIAKLGGARLTGTEAPAFPDTETNFPELQTRITKTIAFLEGLKEADFEGSETRAVTLKSPSRDFNFIGVDFLNRFVLPNVYFHVTTAYAILRHNGVKLGKVDFLGWV